jgi:hypothetical protein
MNVCNKLECLSLADLSSLVSSLWVGPETYLRVECLKGVSLRQAQALWQIFDKAGKATRDKQSSLLQTLINYGRKCFKFDKGSNMKGAPLLGSLLALPTNIKLHWKD